MKHIVLTSMPGRDLASRWNTFLADAQFATHYVSPNYFTDPYVQGERFAILAIDDDRIAAVATGVFDNKKVASGLFSRPQWAFRNGLDRESATAALLSGIDELCDKDQSIEIHSWQQLSGCADHGMQGASSNDETSVVMIDLSKGVDAIFADFSQTRRNELRKAVKQAVVEIKEVETASELAEVYKISCDWNSRKGNANDSFSRMQAASLQRENRRIFIAKFEGKVIAGSFFRYAPGGVVEYAANYSKPEYQKLRPNDLICWHAIQWACDNGLSHFSMGGSHLFLRRFGGEIVKTFRYRRNRNRSAFNNLKESAHELGVGAYRRLPQKLRIGVRKAFTG